MDSLAQQLYGVAADSVKMAANEEIRYALAEFLTSNASMGFPLDSLRFAKSVTPSDLSFRLITWTVPLDQNQFGYFGFIQLRSKSNVLKVAELMDNQGDRNLFQSYPANRWPGAVYSQLIENKTKSGQMFTLFGWIGGESGRSRRIIETLVFDESGEPVFGYPAFALEPSKLQCRVIFEFTDKVPFHLGYEQHRIPGKNKKKSWMIVYNRLGGNDPALGRFFDAPVPSYSTFDGFIFVKQHWEMVRDIDVRSNAKPNERPRETGLFPVN